MTEAVENEPWLVQLEEVIRRRIGQRTLSRIKHLQVEVAEDQIVVRGQASSFHLKQLAIQGIMDEVGTRASAQTWSIVVLIDILPP
jgi:hypothetical protein